MVKLNDSWSQFVVTALFFAGVFYGIAREHVTEAEAIKIAKVEITDRAFPKSDGKVMLNDISHIKDDIKEIKVYVKFLSGLIEKDELEKELGSLSKLDTDCVSRYTESSCYTMLFSCHSRGAIVD